MVMTTQDSPASHYLDWSMRGIPAVWRYILVIILDYLAGMLGAIPEVLLVPQAFADPFQRGVVLQYTFVPGVLTLLLLARLVLGRPASSLFSPAWPLRLRDYGVGVMIGLGIPLILVLPQTDTISANYVGFGAIQRLGPWLIIALVAGYVIQTAFEEMLYRGAVMQLAWRLAPSVALALVLQAVLFALPHFGNVKSWGSQGVITLAPYVVIALGWGWIGWRTGSLLMGMGLHFANNVFAMLVIGSREDAVASYAPILVARSGVAEATVGTLVHTALSVAAVEAWLWWQRRRARRA